MIQYLVDYPLLSWITTGYLEDEADLYPTMPPAAAADGR